MSDTPETSGVGGEQFDDPNREAVGLPPIHTGAGEDPEPEDDPEPEPEPETAKKSKKAEPEEE